MEKAISFGSVMGHPVGGTKIVKKGDFVGDAIIPFYCKNCGYIELYRKIFEKPMTISAEESKEAFCCCNVTQLILEISGFTSPSMPISFASLTCSMQST